MAALQTKAFLIVSSAPRSCSSGADDIVNNAGYTWDSTIQKMTDEQFQAMLDVHLFAAVSDFPGCSRADPRHGQGEAEAGQEVFRKIVNISSIAGLYGNAGQASSAKAALIGISRTLCKEWGRYKVNVNCWHSSLSEPVYATDRS